MERYSPYSCERCGECCRHVDLIDEMKNFDREFFSDMSVAEFHKMTCELCETVRRRELERLHQEVSDA